MAYEFLLYEKQRKGVLITLNGPDRPNAMNKEMRDELGDALEEAEADPQIRAIVLTGAGRSFSTGADMGGPRGETSWPAGLPVGASVGEHIAGIRARDRDGASLLQKMWELSTPVIGAINGWAMGWGSWLAITTHLTYASDRAVFAQPEVRQISNTNFMWTLLAGFKNALRYGLTGDHIDAHEAMRIGLVNEVVPHDELLDTCFTLVERIALNSPDAVGINLFVATRGLEMMGLSNARTLNVELSALAHSSARPEYRQHLEEAGKEGGMRAFIQERDAPFQPEPFGPRSKKREEQPLLAGGVARVHQLVEHAARVLRRRPHVGRPAARLDGARPGVGGEHIGALYFIKGAVLGLALHLEGLHAAADAQLERALAQAGHRQHAGHLRERGHVLGVVHLVE
jgi:enoyl-CoA hydratase/carnithine racemase